MEAEHYQKLTPIWHSVKQTHRIESYSDENLDKRLMNHSAILCCYFNEAMNMLGFQMFNPPSGTYSVKRPLSAPAEINLK